MSSSFSSSVRTPGIMLSSASVFPQQTPTTSSATGWVIGGVAVFVAVVILLWCVFAVPMRRRRRRFRASLPGKPRIRWQGKGRAQAQAQAQAQTQGGEVRILGTDADLREQMQLTPEFIIMFGSAACGHCPGVQPEMKQAAQMRPAVPFLRMEAKDVSKELRRTFGIKAVPSIFRVRGGVPEGPMQSPLAADRIVAFLDQEGPPQATQQQPQQQPAQGVEVADAQLDALSSPRTVVYAYADWCGWSRKVKPNYLAAAASASSVPFVLAEQKNAPRFMERNRVAGYPTILLVDAEGKAVDKYSGDRSTASIVEWAAQAAQDSSQK